MKSCLGAVEGHNNKQRRLLTSFSSSLRYFFCWGGAAWIKTGLSKPAKDLQEETEMWA